MRTKILKLAGVALIAGSLCAIALLLHGTPGGRGVQIGSWLPTATSPR